MPSAGADKLKFLLEHEPQADTAHIEYRYVLLLCWLLLTPGLTYSDVTDLSSLMGDLRALTNLSELFLHGNRLTSLVPDMSQLRR